MPDIQQQFPIKADPDRVFDAVSTPAGLNQWWTETCSGEQRNGSAYQLGFGTGYQWAATVTGWAPRRLFELTFDRADADWSGTRVGFVLSPLPDATLVRFYHRGWPVDNDHYQISCHCWALYLRLLRRYLEYGETVPYPARLEA